MDDCDYSKAETKYGEIILDEAYAGEVYVNGLFVDCNSDLKIRLQFLSQKYIRLERELEKPATHGMLKTQHRS